MHPGTPLSKSIIRSTTLGLIALVAFAGASIRPFPLLGSDPLLLQSLPEVRSGDVFGAFRAVLHGDLPNSFGLWRPLEAASFALNMLLRVGDSRGLHVTGLLLHLIATLIAWRVVRRLLSEWAALFAGALFAVHPMAVGAVTWISGRPEQLLVSLGLGSCWAHLAATGVPARGQPVRSGRSWGLQALAWGLALLAMFAHEGGVLFLGLAPLLAWAASRSSHSRMREWWLRQAGFWLAGLLYVVARILANPQAAAVTPLPGHALMQALGTAKWAAGAAALAVAPNLGWVASTLGEQPLSGMLAPVNPGDLWSGMAALFLFAMFLASLVLLARERRAGAGLLWVLVMLLPTLHSGFAAATALDRLVYPCIFGASLLGAAAWQWAQSRWSGRTWMWTGVACLILAARLGLCLVRSEMWSGEVRLQEAAAREHPKSRVTLTELAGTYAREGESERALPLFRRLYQSDSLDVEAAHNFGMALLEAGHPDSALVVLTPALEARPDFSEIRNARAEALLALGHPAEAVQEFAGVLSGDAEFVAGYDGLARALIANGQPLVAVKALRTGTLVAPHDALMASNLGVLFLQLGQPDSANTWLLRALAVDPALFQAWYKLSQARMQLGDLPGAREAMDHLIALRPDVPAFRQFRDSLEARKPAPGTAHRAVR